MNISVIVKIYTCKMQKTNFATIHEVDLFLYTCTEESAELQNHLLSIPIALASYILDESNRPAKQHLSIFNPPSFFRASSKICALSTSPHTPQPQTLRADLSLQAVAFYIFAFCIFAFCSACAAPPCELRRISLWPTRSGVNAR